MSRKNIEMEPKLEEYIAKHLPSEHPLLKDLRDQTAKMPKSNMQISREQGALLSWLVGLIGAKRIIEVGTFTGYSSLSMGLALPKEGHLLALDISKEYTDTAKRYWERAGIRDKMELRLGPALENLEKIKREGTEKFDMAFLDADKKNYPCYANLLLDLLEPGGILAIDNVLWGGRVMDADVRDKSTAAIRRMNEQLVEDGRCESIMLPVGDGIALARRR